MLINLRAFFSFVVDGGLPEDSGSPGYLGYDTQEILGGHHENQVEVKPIRGLHQLIVLLSH